MSYSEWLSPAFVCIRLDIGGRTVSLARTEGVGRAASIPARRAAASVVEGRHERASGARTLGLVFASLFGLLCVVSLPSDVRADSIEVPKPELGRPAIQEVVGRCQADKADAAACAEAGLRYQDGDGTKADTTIAATFFRRACSLGSHVGCTDLAALMLAGDGVPKDTAAAAALLRDSCAAKYGRACGGVGALAAKGTYPRGKPDPARAMTYFKLACDYGSA